VTLMEAARTLFGLRVAAALAIAAAGGDGSVAHPAESSSNGSGLCLTADRTPRLAGVESSSRSARLVNPRDMRTSNACPLSAERPAGQIRPVGQERPLHRGTCWRQQVVLPPAHRREVGHGEGR